FVIDKAFFEIKPFISWLSLSLTTNIESIGVINFFSLYKPLSLDEYKIKKIQQYLSQLSVVINNAKVYSQALEAQENLNLKNKELDSLSKQISRYLPPQLYEVIFLGKKEVKIESQRKRLTIFFSEIVGFAKLTNELKSNDLTGLLNDYLNDMSKIALEFGGTIDKYIGETIMIFFGDPESKGIKQDAINCVLMAIKMQEHVKLLSNRYALYGESANISIRIGINSGYCTVGNFGSSSRVDYTIIGRQVNLASRLQTSCNAGDILISENTYLLVKNEIPCQMQEMIIVKGIDSPVQSYLVSTAERISNNY
ncbi:MAG: adenylate/guanylate cyclase domain-containing protein, partial [Gammaproteobacteria bacterium]